MSFSPDEMWEQYLDAFLSFSNGVKLAWLFRWMKGAIKKGEGLSGLQSPDKGSRFRFNS